MKKGFILFSLLFTFSIANAKLVNWVVALVNNEPITYYDIQETMKKNRVPQQQAINLLVDDRLLQAQVKLLGITVTPYEVDKRVQDIITHNKLSEAQFKSALAKQGLTLQSFKQNLEKELKKEKLYGALFEKSDSTATPETIEKYYETHKTLFSNFTSINLTRFFSQNPKSLERLISTGKTSSDIISKNFVVSKKQLDPRTQEIFSNIPNGQFTQIVPSFDNYYEVIRINSKSGMVVKPFEEVKEQVLNMYVMEQRRKEADEFFAKLRSKAVVKFLQEPKDIK